MRIHHTPNEFYYVKSFYFNGYNDINEAGHWYPYKIYHSKQAALNGIKNAKSILEKKGHKHVDDLVWKIVWYAYPFAPEDTAVVVYTEESK